MASHNPPEYNAYKVYWQDGAKITYPKDEEIIGMVNNVTNYKMVMTMSKEDAQKQGLLHMIGENVDARYMEELKKLVVNSLVIKEMANELKIVYTPIHGSGNVPVRRILEELGFTNVYVVKEQELPDGEFPTVSYPNPEDPAVFELAKEKDADLILATDPDADRLGAYVKNPKTSEYEALTGNMSGILICEYLLSQKLEKRILAKNEAIVKTIVTTDMADLVAKEYAVNLMTTLTGFKYIGEQIKFFEQQNSNVTYRVYDYGRVGLDGKKRDLHIEKALAVTNRDPKVRVESFEPHLGTCKYFTVDKMILDGRFMQKMTGKVDGDSFLHILILEGYGSIVSDGETKFSKGDSILLTAATGEFEISGCCEALLTTIPYMENQAD